MQLSHLDHIVLRVNDPQQMVQFATAVLGTTVERELDIGLISCGLVVRLSIWCRLTVSWADAVGHRIHRRATWTISVSASSRLMQRPLQLTCAPTTSTFRRLPDTGPTVLVPRFTSVTRKVTLSN